MFDEKYMWNKTVYKILKHLSRHPLERYHVREIARRIDVSPSSASQILKKLHQQHLVKKNKIGRQLFYQADMENPVVKQFKVLINILALYETVEKLKQKSKRIVLFGSAAQGNNTADSDFDLFIECENPKSVKKMLQHKKRISPVVVETNSLQEFKENNSPLYENIHQGIELWRKK